MAFKQGRSTRSLGAIKNKELDFQFMRTLTPMSEGGATLGECLIVRDKATDSKSFAEGWFELGMDLEKRADAHNKAGHVASAKECYTRAANYYRAAVNNYSPLAEPKQRHESWQRATHTFERMGAMLQVPMERIDVPFEGGVLPCYWLKPHTTTHGKSAPALMAVTGGEGTAIEEYFMIGAAGARRGYNVFLCEIPGNTGAMYRNNSRMTLRYDTEKPIGAILDVVTTLKGVDASKIGLTGYSYGGYFAARAACFDTRIAALIPDTPLRDAYGLWTAVLPAWFLNTNIGPKFIGAIMSRIGRNTVHLVEWLTQTDGIQGFIDFTKQCNITEIEGQITCPVLALSGEGEGTLFNSQADAFYRSVASKVKAQHLFTQKEGGGAHCQVDNYNLLQEVTYNWLDEVLVRR